MSISATPGPVSPCGYVGQEELLREAVSNPLLTALRRLAEPSTPARHWNLWTVLALEWWLARLDALPRDFALEPVR